MNTTMESKMDFELVFPTGVYGTKTMKVEANPMVIRKIAEKTISEQEMIFGRLCIIQDWYKNVYGVIYSTESNGIKFFTEEEEPSELLNTEGK